MFSKLISAPEDFSSLLSQARDPDPAKRATLLKTWPKDAPFFPERFGISLNAHSESELLEELKYLDEQLERRAQQAQQTAKCIMDEDFDFQVERRAQQAQQTADYIIHADFDFYVRFQSRHETEWIVLAHQFPALAQAIHPLISKVRIGRAQEFRNHKYHDWALVYYAAIFGSATHGAGEHGNALRVSLRRLLDRGIYRPKILILGFSSIYSIENIASIAHLVGFKGAEIFALDVEARPLKLAQEQFPISILDYPIKYIQEDGRSMTAADGTYDLVITHRLLTHLPDTEKGAIYKEAARVLRQGADFLDEEPFVNTSIDWDRYRRGDWVDWLLDEYKGPARFRNFIQTSLKSFAQYSVFYPYREPGQMERDMDSGGLHIVEWQPIEIPFHSILDRVPGQVVVARK